jgi:septal ring factor EnvC (AmiA/AmiB activator)
MKRKPALIAAFLTTFVIAIAMILVGANALFNPNSVPVSASPTSVSANGSSGVVEVSANTGGNQLQQLQDLIAQYQSREQQYQQREQQLQQQLNDATTQVQQLQSVLQQLQQIGVIRIGANGQISVPRRFGN